MGDGKVSRKVSPYIAVIETSFVLLEETGISLQVMLEEGAGSTRGAS